IRSKEIHPTHVQLARLLSLLGKRPKGRKGVQEKQLVIATGLDVMTERALLLAGLSFTRIVQHGSDPRVTVNQYHNVTCPGEDCVRLVAAGGGVARAKRDDLDGLDELIARCEPSSITYKESPLVPYNLILYKLCGSCDVPSSCIISAHQYFKFARQMSESNSI